MNRPAVYQCYHPTIPPVKLEGFLLTILNLVHRTSTVVSRLDELPSARLQDLDEFIS